MKTPLHMAVQSGNATTVNVILHRLDRQDVNPNAKDKVCYNYKIKHVYDEKSGTRWALLLFLYPHIPCMPTTEM